MQRADARASRCFPRYDELRDTTSWREGFSVLPVRTKARTLGRDADSIHLWGVHPV